MEANFNTEAARLIESRLSALRRLTFSEAAVLPEAASEETTLAGVRCNLNVFRQTNSETLPDAILVAVQVSRSTLISVASHHTERGLVFGANGQVREAADDELRNTGG